MRAAARRTLAALVAVGAVLHTAPAASAHATLDKTSVPAGTDQTLTARIPVERPGAFNVRVIIEIPDGFGLLSCTPKLGWSCHTTPPRGRSAALATWERESGLDAIDLLEFVVHTADRPGLYAFETNQEYSDGEWARWDEAPDGDHPAPRLEVTGERVAPRPNVEEPAPHPVADPETTSTSSVTFVDATSSTSVAPTTVASPSAAAASNAEPRRVDGTIAAAPSNQVGAGALPGVAAAGAASVVLGAIVLVRRRR